MEWVRKSSLIIPPLFGKEKFSSSSTGNGNGNGKQKRNNYKERSNVEPKTIHGIYRKIYGSLNVRSVNSLGFTAWSQKKQAGRTRLFFCDQAYLKRFSRLKNQSASIDASGSARFFFVSEQLKEKKSGGLGVNKRNRGYPAVLNSSNALLK